MITCPKNDSILVSAGCVPDTGPPVPANWSDPQPAGLVITGWDPTAFDNMGGCPVGGALDSFNGKLPVQFTTSSANLKYWPAGLVPGTTPHLIQTSGCLIETRLVAGPKWSLAIQCSTGFGNIWIGEKLVGLTPVGTYMRIAGTATVPDCLHVAEQTFDWSSMVWVDTSFGTATAFGLGATFAVSATPPVPVSSAGIITGTMSYTGPVAGAKVRVTVTGADTGGFSSFRVRVNGNTVVVVPTVGFAVGVTDHYFTIQDPANPGSPLVGATIEVRALAQSNVVGNNPAFSGILT